MLIYEDFQESGQTQTALKKVGFDVLGTSHMTRLSDQVLTFNPDVIVAYGGIKYPSMYLGKELKKVTHFRGKSILIIPAGERPLPTDIAKARVDMMIEAPVQPTRLILILSKILGFDPLPFLEKFNKAKISDVEDDEVARLGPDSPINTAQEMVIVKGSVGPTQGVKIEDKARVEGYQKFIQGMKIDLKQTSHSRQAVKNRQEDLQKGWDFGFLDQIDKLKREFAAALFKKNG